MTTDVLIKLGINILLMLSLTTLVLSGEKSGLLSIITRPLNKIIDNKIIMIAWFLISTVLSAFTLDTTLAMILIPIALVYATSRKLNKGEILIAVTWGNMVGSEWTYFGGGDTIVSWTLLTQYLNRPLDMIIWAKLFWAPTLLACILTLVWLYFKVLSPVIVKPLLQEKLNVNWANVLTWIVVIVGMATIFYTQLQWYTVGLAVLSILLSRLSLDDFKKLPFKAIYIWTASVILGVLVNQYVASHFQFVIPTYVYSLLGIITVFVVISIIHLGITDSGMSLIFLPIVMASQFTDIIWLYVLMTKAISLSYLTIFSNGGLAVSASYGLSQREMLKKGIPIVILQTILFALYFYFMRGHIAI
ncbi:sodium:proton antiporter [Candidatus Formimonas warabiya]|uniref:Uncharacterized protein n=1 Tax=Formimonas warabiya TaxID=1761012 RepID=A0A3G1KZI7_FORW1|nr:sodium:proton antiporter [Candidatus Formimonas warabiya]ATW27956.1 hypothetical protein DCMF_27230 [Candidatus Formimonas warabiya]